jgi:hypothetical protein
MANRSAREVESKMIATAFEHALDDLWGLATQPPPEALDEAWADDPTRMAVPDEPTRTVLLAGYASERLDAAALFGDLQTAPPAAAITTTIAPLDFVAVTLPHARSIAPTVQIRRAARSSKESRLVAIAVVGALALVAVLAACNYWHAGGRRAIDVSAQISR